MTIESLIDVMRKLRDPLSGCPWDREQTFATIVPYTIEEAYEVAGAVDQGNLAALQEELGDLLLQVVFHARMAEEQGEFAFGDVVNSIVDKLVRRHPHVFGTAQVASAAEQSKAWETLKAIENDRGPNGQRSVLAGVCDALPALTRAAKLGRRAGSVGFDWSDLAGVISKVREELLEIEQAAQAEPARLEEEIGDLLFAAASLARHAEVDPEEALRKANHKFAARFSQVEDQVRATQRPWTDLSAEELDQFWIKAKLAGQP